MDPIALELESIKDILARKALVEFLGVQESQHLEAKPLFAYRDSGGTHTSAHCAELAKDVAAMANGGGGFMVLGAHTIEHASLRVDTIDSFTADRPDDAYMAAIKTTLKKHIKPRLVCEIEVCDDDAGKVALVIRVPARRHQYYFATYNFEEGGKLKQYLLVPKRVGSDINFVPCDEIVSMYREPLPVEAAMMSLQEQIARLADEIQQMREKADIETAVHNSTPIFLDPEIIRRIEGI